MAMLLLLDSNFRASFRFGARQLLPVFSEAVQSKIRGAPDRVSLVSQITYFMKTLPPSSKVALIFGQLREHFDWTTKRGSAFSDDGGSF
jgi:hypothetical protein